MEDLNPIRRWFAEWRTRWHNINGTAVLRLGDAAGESRLSIRNSNDEEVFYFASNGTSNIEPTEGAAGEALMRGGGRSLIGNLVVDDGVTIDGVDISLLSAGTAAWQSAHTAAGQHDVIRIGADVEIGRAGANVAALGTGDSLQSSSFSSGAYGYRLGDDGNAEFNNIRARGEFAASVFRRSEISAAAGTLGVFPGASVVHADFTTPGSVGSSVSASIRNETPTSGTALFSSEDILQVKTWNGTTFVNAYLKVNASPAPVAATGYTTYSLLLMNGSVGAAVAAGTAIVNTGTSSGGAALLLSADGSVGGAPNMTMQTHTGVPWEPTVISRFGNLSGITDSVFGVLSGYGTYVAGNAYVTGAINASGGQISGVLGIGTSGEIRQGTGSLTASPATFTGTRMWSDNGVGRIGGYNSGALQWYAGTDGRFYAAEGNVVLDKDGLRISTDASSNYPNQKGLSFVSNMHLASSSRFGVYSFTDLVIDYSVLSLKNTGSETGTYAIDIRARDNVTLYGESSVEMNIYGASFQLRDGAVQISCGVYAYNGLNVGTATGAATGEIKASAGISGTTGTFSSTLGVTGASTLAALSATTGTFSGGLNVGGATGATTGQVKASAGISGTTGTFSSALSATSGTLTGGLNVGAATAATTGQIYMQGNSTKIVATNAQNGSAAFTFEYESGATISRKGYLQFATNAASPFNADLTFVSQGFGERVKFEGNTGNMLVHAGGNSNRPAAPRDTLHLNKQGAGAQTHGMTISSNDTDVAEFFWSSSGAAIVQALIGNDSVLLQPAGTGRVRAAGLLTVEGDGTGAASTVGFSNVTNGVGTGNGTVKVNGTTARDSTGWLKIYVGTAVRYIPYWTTITG